MYGDKGIAHASYILNLYGGEVITGYRFNISNNMILVPTTGLRYLKTLAESYKESGLAKLNQTRNKRNYSKFSGVLGLAVKTNIDWKEFILIPELHGNYNVTFRETNSDYLIYFDGFSTPSKILSRNNPKLSGNLGIGITLNNHKFQITTIYDALITKKYLSHQGTINVSVKL